MDGFHVDSYISLDLLVGGKRNATKGLDDIAI